MLEKSIPIIFICENDLTLQIGGTIHVRQIISALNNIHPNIRLIVPDYHHRGLEDFGVDTLTIKTPRIRIIKWLYFFIYSTCIIYRLSLKQKIIVYSREMPYNIFLSLMCRLFYIPLYIELNGVNLSEMKDLGYSRLSYIISRFIEKIVLSPAIRITCVSDEIKNVVSQEFKIPETIFVTIPNGTNIEKFRPIDKSQSRKKIGLPDDKYIIGFIGSCYPYHDIDSLIKSIPILINDIPQIHLTIVGDGYMLPEWKHLVETMNLSDNVTFTGYVPFDLANNYINSFDICFASYKQGTSVFPMKILDYMACNKPVITSNIPTITKYFKDTNNFKIVNPGSTSELSNAMTGIYRNKDQIIKEHREFVINNYTWDHSAEKIIQTIQETLCVVSPE